MEYIVRKTRKGITINKEHVGSTHFEKTKVKSDRKIFISQDLQD